MLDLTNEQWEYVEPFLPVKHLRGDNRGRPPEDARSVLNGILWVLRTEAPWRDLPKRYPSRWTCCRRYNEWRQSGILKGVLLALALDLKQRGRIDIATIGIPKWLHDSPAAKGWRRDTVRLFLSQQAAATLGVGQDRQGVVDAHLNLKRTRTPFLMDEAIDTALDPCRYCVFCTKDR